MEFGVNTKFVLGFSRAKQLGSEHCKKTPPSLPVMGMITYSQFFYGFRYTDTNHRPAESWWSSFATILIFWGKVFSDFLFRKFRFNEMQQNQHHTQSSAQRGLKEMPPPFYDSVISMHHLIRTSLIRIKKTKNITGSKVSGCKDVDLKLVDFFA